MIRRNRLLALAIAMLLAIVLPTLLPEKSVEQTVFPQLTVSSNHRFLVRADGSPFFYLGDTAWELFHRLDREEAERYLQNRVDKKYTVIQAVALAELDGLNTPNAYGAKPLLNNNPSTPDTTDDPARYDYWDHVDYIIDRAAAHGLFVGLLPTWGSHVDDGTINASNAQAYGEFLGKRYADKPVIWIMGGDRPADGKTAVWRNLAKGIAIGVSGTEDYRPLLMTYHPRGGQTSSTWFHGDRWLKFNMQQNGHCANVDVWNRIEQDYRRTPTKPVMDGEPLYEDHPICFDAVNKGFSDDYEIRKFAYWNVFAGAHGHTYGNHAVWQMFAPDRGPINGPLLFWDEAIDQPGAAQMQYLRSLMESRPLLDRIPDQTMLASDPGSGTNHIQATRASDGSYGFVYSAAGQPFSVRMDKISGQTATAYWYDPRNGKSALIDSFTTQGVREFTPPSRDRGNDWVLVLDNADRNFPDPGQGSFSLADVSAPSSSLTQSKFYRAINLNGEAATIDGQAWEGETAPNYRAIGETFTNESVALTPATDDSRAAMIRSSVWGSAVRVTLTDLPAATYSVWLYVWEDNSPETFSILLQGQTVQTRYNSGTAGTWAKLGPWTVPITNGRLTIATSGGAANLSGIEVWKSEE